jgi:hypothetical protein
MDIYTHTCTYLCFGASRGMRCVFVYVCMCVCVHRMCTQVHIPMHTRMHIQMHAHIYTSVRHTHTHSPTLPPSHTHTHSGKRLPVGHFALAAMSLLGVRPSELREVLVKAKFLTSFLSMIAYSKYTRVLILENSVSVLFLPDRAAAPPECLGCVTSVTSFKRWGSPLLSLLSPVEECPAIVRGRRRGRRGL